MQELLLYIPRNSRRVSLQQDFPEADFPEKCTGVISFRLLVLISRDSRGFPRTSVLQSILFSCFFFHVCFSEVHKDYYLAHVNSGNFRGSRCYHLNVHLFFIKCFPEITLLSATVPKLQWKASYHVDHQMAVHEKCLRRSILKSSNRFCDPSIYRKRVWPKIRVEICWNRKKTPRKGKYFFWTDFQNFSNTLINAGIKLKNGPGESIFLKVLSLVF